MPQIANSESAPALIAWLPATALALAMVLGGGGSPTPMPELVLQLALAMLFALWAIARTDGPLPRAAVVAAALAAALPLVQLVPLPPGIWQALPGRTVEHDALGLIGAQESWRPWSMAPAQTLAALLALYPALGLMLMVAGTNRPAADRIVAVLSAIGFASLLLGAAQLSGGAMSPLRLYGETRFPDAFQANHNSTADVLLLALVATAGWLRAFGDRPAASRTTLALAGGGMAMLALGVVLTGSRAGIALLPVALIGAAALLRPRLAIAPRRMLEGAAALAVAILGATMLLRHNAALGRVAARFTFDQELRPDLWRDAAYAARQYFPFGSGLGNFVPSMLPAERLETVRETMPNRAHNDFLELAVEAGAFGLAVLAAISALLVRVAVRARRAADGIMPGQVLVGLTGLVVLGLHSLVDYPFRSMALACAGAACAGLILRHANNASPPGQSVAPKVVK